MASNTKLSSTILILSVLFLSTLSNACETCKPKPPPPACPPPPKKMQSPPKSPPRSPPKAPPMSPPTATPSCPRDILRLGACADLLGGLVNVIIGSPPSRESQCCSLLQGLADLDAAVCLCTAIRANVLGINLNVPLTLSLLVNACDRTLPPNFRCE